MSRSPKTEMLYEEAQRTLEQQIKRSKQISDRAHRLLRAYILAISAVGAVFSGFLNGSDSLPSLFDLMGRAEKVGLAMASLVFGIFTLFFALIALGLSISETTLIRGLGSEDLKRLNKSTKNHGEIQKYVLQSGYIKWIDKVSNQNYKRQQMLKYAYWLSGFAVLLFFIFALEVA